MFFYVVLNFKSEMKIILFLSCFCVAPIILMRILNVRRYNMTLSNHLYMQNATNKILESFLFDGKDVPGTILDHCHRAKKEEFANKKRNRIILKYWLTLHYGVLQ